MRKIIQINTGDDGVLYALCDDGSVWYQFYDRDTKLISWKREIDIPQDEVKP